MVYQSWILLKLLWLLSISCRVETIDEACPTVVHAKVNISGNNCSPCAVNEYKSSSVGCTMCPNGTSTWGRLGVADETGCTEQNPIQVSTIYVNIVPPVQPGATIVTFNASYSNGSLAIPPLSYDITGITKTNKNARSSDDVTSRFFNSCNQFENSSIFHSFCMFRHNGTILANKNFSCIDGDQFVINVNVSDSGSASQGIISNSHGSAIITCNDECKTSRQLYQKSVSACISCTNGGLKSENDTYTNTDRSREMEIHLPSNKTILTAVYLKKNVGAKLSNCCYLKIHLTKNGVRRTIVNPVNLVNDAITFDKPYTLTGPTLGLSLLCNDSISSFSNITSVTLTFLVKRDVNCTDVNSVCLQSLYQWKIQRVSQCNEDPLQLMKCYGHCIGAPKISFGPNPWRVTHGNHVRLYCNVTSLIPVGIEWLKNNIKVDSSQSILVEANTTNQGYYTCKVSNIYGCWRKTTLLVLSDHFTSYLKMKVTVNVDSNNSDDICITTCKRIVNLLGKYSTGSCKNTRKSDGHTDVDCTLYGKRNNTSIDEYYNTLINALRQLEINNIKTNTMSVRDAEYCLKDTTGTVNYQGTFEWISTKSRKTTTVPCPYSPHVIASRRCAGNFNTGASWNRPNDENCDFKSKNTEALNKLNNTKVDSSNAKEVAQNLTAILTESSSKDLTGTDASFAANMLENIVSITDRLNETADLVLKVVDTIMEMNTTAISTNNEAASKIISVLDKVAKNIPIEEGKTSKVLTTGNLVLQANKVDKISFKGATFGIKSDGSVVAAEDDSIISVDLPSSLLDNSNKSSTRIGFIYYANNKLFQSKLEGNSTKLSDNILSSSVYDTKTSSLSEPVKLKIPRLKGEDKDSLRNASCVYWDEQDRKWLGDGCHVCSDSDSVLCCCDHLTNFAVLFSPQPSIVQLQEDHVHNRALSIITYIGCGISLIGVILTFITYLLFRQLRKTNQQPILMNICVAIFLLLIVFIAGINSTNHELGCQIVAVLLHYLTLVTVLWMGIEAYNLYLQIVKVMAIYHRKFMLKAAIIGWGIPMIIVLATTIAASIEYKQDKKQDKTFKYGNRYACILHDHLYRIIAWFVPILGILLFNLVVFITLIYKLHSTGVMITVDSKSQQRRHCWTAVAIMCLLGVTWLFGALAISDARIIFEYLFCIFNSLQGFFIFFFHCVRIKEVRNQWSFFASGLGFSHRESESSNPRSKGFGESHHSSEAFVKVRDWIDKDSDNHTSKGTVLTSVSSNQEEEFSLHTDNTGNNNSYML